MTKSDRGRSDPTLPLERFHPAVRNWFSASFGPPTAAQALGWPAIARGLSTLILAPTGGGKTLAAFLWAINRIMVCPLPPAGERCRVLYISPLKALAVDVDRNLRRPLEGIMEAADEPLVAPRIAVRTGDTPSRERARFRREPADILITTPESLYLLLTSAARETLRSVETVIVDEIHALVPGKRGAHLAVSLERLEALCAHPPQRIGLSATQHPLEEVARFLGGVAGRSAPGEASSAEYRPVAIVDTGEPKQFSLRVEIPLEQLEGAVPPPVTAGSSSSRMTRGSIWPAMFPRLLQLVEAHRSTLIFANSRRLSERICASLNDLAGRAVARSHHGSIAREQRAEIEEELKSGRLPALVATSSLELGIDMGAIDLVVQIEAPPAVASAMQRIGRAGHHAGAVSEGVIFPRYRSDLLASAAITRAMSEGRIERVRYPRNPLDILAQQIVAMVAMDEWKVDDLFSVIRRAAPFAELSPAIYHGVLDMLSGLYPSDDFAGLRARITWNRVTNRLTPRAGAQRIAVVNGGTIPDRGLYGVFLAGSGPPALRVGELDEEMVFESRIGETFLLGASSWRIEEITHDRVLVTPAPGEPGKMPFWHGDAAGRSVELGEEIGALIGKLGSMARSEAIAALQQDHFLDAPAAGNLIDYLEEQRASASCLPDRDTIVVERGIDELGAWRLCVLSFLGGRVHAPWAMAVTANVRDQTGLDVETMWTDDGLVVRFPELEAPPDTNLLFPSTSILESLVRRQLGASALFAAKFREIASRALLLPRRQPGRRVPLWQQRKRSADLLQVTSRFRSFPMLLETWRECLVDVFDIPSLAAILERVEQQRIRVVLADTTAPSPFAASLLFRYVANYIYDDDAPLAERRAQALSVDPQQLRELLGEIDLRELLDAVAVEELERRLQHREEGYRAASSDALHDLLLAIGDLTPEEISERSEAGSVSLLSELSAAHRALEISIRGSRRFIAVEDASRFRDAVGIALPAGIADRLLIPVADPLEDILSRYARTHGPFTSSEPAERYGLSLEMIESALLSLARRGLVVQGGFRPGGLRQEWCHTEVLRALRRNSLARLRREIAPVEPEVYARFLLQWHGVTMPRRGPDALLQVIRILQGFPLPVSILESEILSRRVDGYRPSELDMLASSGEVVWIGAGSLGERDGRVMLFTRRDAPRLAPPNAPFELSGIEQNIVELLESRGALFFQQLSDSLGRFPAESLDALWNLVWKGIVTNDTFHPLRSRVRRARSPAKRGSRRHEGALSPGSEGRWSLTASISPARLDSTERLVAVAEQLLARHGIVGREVIPGEQIADSFTPVYRVLGELEQRGSVRRGYFVAGLAATQFASHEAVERLRSVRPIADHPEVILLPATDPANPHGALFRWPAGDDGRAPSRSVGAAVILIDGMLAAYIPRGGKQLSTFLPAEEPLRTSRARLVARRLADQVRDGERRALLISTIDGVAAAGHLLADAFRDEGFIATAGGLQFRLSRPAESDREDPKGEAGGERGIRTLGRGQPPTAV